MILGLSALNIKVEILLCLFIPQAFGCIDQDRDGVIKKQDLKETYGQLGIFLVIYFCI